MTITNKEDLTAQLAGKPVLLAGTHTMNSVQKHILRYFERNEIKMNVIGLASIKIKQLNPQAEVAPINQTEYHGVKMGLLDEFLPAAPDTILVLADRDDGKWELCKQIAEQKGFNNIVVLDFELYASLVREECPNIDFLCAGFVKCGTTTLHAALKDHKSLYLTNPKENKLLIWRDKTEDAEEFFYNRYYKKAPKNKIYGDIEPTYHVKARDAYECFGKDLKVVFLMRNPINAFFSYYRHHLRCTNARLFLDLYKKYHKPSPKMFDAYLDIILDEEKRAKRSYAPYTGLYAPYVEEYIKYFGRENVMLVFFEEFIKNPEESMNEIQDFVGLPRETFKDLPHANDGKTISRNYLSAWLNMKLRNARVDQLRLAKYTSKKRKFLLDHRKQIESYSLVEDKSKMTEEQYKRLYDFFKPSVDQLQKYTNKALSEIWF